MDILTFAPSPPDADADRDWTDACVHRLFAQQAARTPEATALVCGGRQLTYRRLDERANQLAHYLRRRRVGPETLVGVALPRSLDLVVALLGVWKAGAAYVPLDPGYPPERLAFLVRDAGLRLLLTAQELCPLFAGTPAKAICLDADWPLIALERSDDPAAGATPANLAYVMYTSGSTGQPKGAMIEHGGLANYLRWAVEAYGFAAGRTALLHSSIAFDLTVTSLYPPLLVGGKVELLAEDGGARSLLDALRRGLDGGVVKLTPAHLDLLGQQLGPDEMAALSGALVIGGESLLAESLRPWRRHAPALRLFNEYGPTEAVVGCCVHEVGPGDPDSGAVSIGRAIPNTRLHVLDADLRPLPPGSAGELFIGGAGVARGYLNRPQQTGERFLADPFSTVPGARLYRTGDLARVGPDGALEFLGRLDDQVKIRGYRIELGEVEANLAAHEGVQACTVLAPEISPGNRQLVAHVVPRGAAPPAADALRNFLAQRLPDFMVPDRFVFRHDFPLTRNGKVDRQALMADPSAGMAAPRPPSRLPRTPVEERVAAIWRELLGIEHIGIDDDIFDLGVRSLQAVKAVAEMRSAFDVDLQLRHLFEQPTVAGLGQAIEGLLWLARPKGAEHSRELEEIEI